MKPFALLSALLFALLLPTIPFAQEVSRDADAVEAPADDAPMCVVEADATVEMTLDGTSYDCFPASDDGGTERMYLTTCYCGQYNGSALYLTVDCSGYPGGAGQVCCSEKCGILTDALDGSQ